MKYVLMDSSHVEMIADIEQQCFSAPWSLKSITSELTNPLSLWVVAEDAGRVAGYVGSQSVMGEADMMNIAVLPEYRRHGIGYQLVNELVDKLRKNGVYCLSLEVRSSNVSAINLYDKLGFTKVGCRPGYYSNPKEDAWILRKEWEV